MLFLRAALQERQIIDLLNPSHRNVFARRHFIAHEVLKNYAHLAVQIFQVVVAQVDAIEQICPSVGS